MTKKNNLTPFVGNLEFQKLEKQVILFIPHVKSMKTTFWLLCSLLFSMTKVYRICGIIFSTDPDYRMRQKRKEKTVISQETKQKASDERKHFRLLGDLITVISPAKTITSYFAA